MKTIIKNLVILVVIFLIHNPKNVLAIGEYDGLWIGQIGIENFTTTMFFVVYQETDEVLYISEECTGKIKLVKSENEWILPASVYSDECEIEILSMNLTFQSQDRVTGWMEVNVGGGPLGTPLSLSKQDCEALLNDIGPAGLAGAEDSYRCFKVDLPEGTQSLTVTTTGGTGDCDLEVLRYRPEFDYHFSLNDANEEKVSVISPRAGTWYIMLYGYESYSGVVLFAHWEAGIIGVPPGLISFDVGPDEQLRLDLNITNSHRDAFGDIKAEWLVFTGTVGGAQLPIFVLTSGGQIFDVGAVTDLNAVTYRFNHSSDVATIATLAMGSLGLKAGDTLVYGYAYTTSDVSKVMLDNIVTVNVK